MVLHKMKHQHEQPCLPLRLFAAARQRCLANIGRVNLAKAKDGGRDRQTIINHLLEQSLTEKLPFACIQYIVLLKSLKYQCVPWADVNCVYFYLVGSKNVTLYIVC